MVMAEVSIYFTLLVKKQKSSAVRKMVMMMMSRMIIFVAKTPFRVETKGNQVGVADTWCRGLVLNPGLSSPFPYSE